MSKTALIKNREARNASWIIVCRVVQAVLNFIVSSLTAKYLGPSRYGLTYYASSVTAFLIPVCLLGLSDIMVRELVENPDREGEILGTSLLMSLGSSVLCMSIMALFVRVTNGDDKEAALFCALYSISMLFQGMEILSAWFQSKLLSKYTSTISLCAFVLVSVYKSYLLISSKSIYWFAFSNTLDYALITIPYFIFYKKNGGDKIHMGPLWDFDSAFLIKKNWSKAHVVEGLPFCKLFAMADGQFIAEYGSIWIGLIPSLESTLNARMDALQKSQGAAIDKARTQDQQRWGGNRVSLADEIRTDKTLLHEQIAWMNGEISKMIIPAK